MTPAQHSSREGFAHGLAADASSGRKAMVLAPLGAGKTHTLLRVAATLHDTSIPFVFVDLFTAASTPEKLLATLVGAVHPFMHEDAEAIEALARDGASDRHRSSAALLRLLELLATRPASRPFVWLVDEVTEIRSLAYFPDLNEVERPFARALLGGRGAVLTSSYLGLARDLFPDLEALELPAWAAGDLAQLPSPRSAPQTLDTALALTRGSAATLLPLLSDLRDSRDLVRSLIHLLMPGGALELVCRRHYEVLLLRSRGYAVAKRAAEVVASGHGGRLTDLFPRIGRTAGASRQYLRWLVEVGLLTQVKKRYGFADPVLGLWAGLYLDRGGHPTEGEIRNAVTTRLAEVEPGGGPGAPNPGAVRDRSVRRADDRAGSGEPPAKRVDRFEEFD